MNIFIASIQGNAALLTRDESWHCTKVLRKKPGDHIRLIDGQGNFYEAELSAVSEKQCVANIISGPTPDDKRNYHLHLAIAPTKQIDRIEWMIEKAVEIGLDEISFFSSKNSERTVIKTDRIRKITESAVKQSLQACLPIVNELVSFKDFVKNCKADIKLIAHCFDKPRQEIRTMELNKQSIVILIGPEGDFTNEEIDLALNNNFTGISLGSTRLRTETAGLYACQAVSLLHK